MPWINLQEILFCVFVFFFSVPRLSNFFSYNRAFNVKYTASLNCFGFQEIIKFGLFCCVLEKIQRSQTMTPHPITSVQDIIFMVPSLLLL